MADPFVGKLTYFRVYSGTLNAGSKILNVTTGRTERVGRLLVMHANDREEVDAVYAGDIAAAVGIKQITTGDTLCAPERPVRLENIDFPEPVIKVAVEPKTKVDQEKMSVALGRLAEEDPTFQVQTNEETGQVEISGMGELHLEILVDRMKREYGVEANVGRPQVSYRETIRGTAAQGRGPLRQADRRLGPVRHRLHRHRAEPRRGLRVRVEDQGRLRAERVHPRRRQGRRGGAARPASRPATRWSTSRSRSSTASTTTRTPRRSRSRSPARWRSRRRRSGPSPSCSSRSSRSRSTAPEDYVGDVIGDLMRRRGHVEGQERRGNAIIVTAHVPLSEMFGYVGDLRSNTQGRASYSMQFDRYDEVPPHIAEKVVEHRMGEPVPA